MQQTAAALAQELATYEAHRAELVRKHDGKAVLIKHNRIIGVFDDLAAAMDRGEELFPGEAFFVRKIAAVDEPVVFTLAFIGG
jgi:hypothetical protein